MPSRRSVHAETRPVAVAVTGSVARWDGEVLTELPWMRMLHKTREAVPIESHPEILGDVFAWNKLFRTSFWRAQGLEWPEGVMYEDQPTTTRAFLAGTFENFVALSKRSAGSFSSAFATAAAT